MTPYIIITMQIGARTLTISKTSLYRLISISGIESADYVADVQNYAGMDGGYISAYRVPARSIDLSFAVDRYPWQDDTVEDTRAALISFFAPRADITLTIERAGRVRCISGRLRGSVTFTQANIIEDKLTVTVPLICPDPYFRDSEITSQGARRYAPLMSFPYVSMAGVGMTAGIAVNSDSVIIDNAGDTSMGIVATLSCYGGAVTNPKISCGAAYVRLLRECVQGDIIVIDTRQGRKGITVNGTSVFLFDRASIFFEVAAGKSQIDVSADANVGNMQATISYERRWLGV